MKIPARFPNRFRIWKIPLSNNASPRSDTHRARLFGTRNSLSWILPQSTNPAASPKGIQRSGRPSHIRRTAPASMYTTSRLGVEISIRRPGVSRSMYSRARFRPAGTGGRVFWRGRRGIPSEYRLEVFRLLRNRLPYARRLWSKGCLTTIHLVAPERKSRHFISGFNRNTHLVVLDGPEPTTSVLSGPAALMSHQGSHFANVLGTPAQYSTSFYELLRYETGLLNPPQRSRNRPRRFAKPLLCH